MEFGTRIPNNPETYANHWVFAGLTLRGWSPPSISAARARPTGASSATTSPARAATGRPAASAPRWPSHVLFYGNEVHHVGAESPQQPSKQYHAVYFTTDTVHVDAGWNDLHDNRTCRAIQVHSSPLCLPDCGPSDTTGFNQYDVLIHDNWIDGDACDGIVVATVDPSQGPVRIYNNILIHVGAGPHPPDGEANYSCIYVAGGTNTGPDGKGVVEVSNNTCYDVGAVDPTWADAGAFGRGPGSPDLVMELRNNLVLTLPGQPYFTASTDASLVRGESNLWFGSGPGPDFLTGNIDADPRFVDLTGARLPPAPRQPGDRRRRGYRPRLRLRRTLPAAWSRFRHRGVRVRRGQVGLPDRMPRRRKLMPSPRTQRLTLGCLAAGALALLAFIAAAIWFFLPPSQPRLATLPVRIRIPGQGARLALEQTHGVLVEATGVKDLSRVELWVDGQLAAAQVASGDPLPAAVHLGWRPAAAGAHTLIARAIDRQGTTGRSLPIVVEAARPRGGGDDTCSRQRWRTARRSKTWPPRPASLRRRSAMPIRACPIAGRRFDHRRSGTGRCLPGGAAFDDGADVPEAGDQPIPEPEPPAGFPGTVELAGRRGTGLRDPPRPGRAVKAPMSFSRARPSVPATATSASWPSSTPTATRTPTSSPSRPPTPTWSRPRTRPGSPKATWWRSRCSGECEAFDVPPDEG